MALALTWAGAGCRQPQYTPARANWVPVQGKATNRPTPKSVPVEAPLAPERPTAPAAPLVPSNPRIVAPPVEPAGWVRMDHAGQARGWGLPVRNHSGTNLLYQWTTPQGSLVLKIGSRVASWGGAEIWLGFPPQLVANQPAVHPLDLRKNIDALAAPLVFPARQDRVLVIDPGHGGENFGAKSVYNQRYEKEYTLDWALRLKPLAEARGWKVFLTRTRDYEVALSNRVAFAEMHRADLFLSLHFNSAGTTQAGLESYCFTPVGMASHVTRGYDDNPAVAYANNAFDIPNLQYAYHFHKIVKTFAQVPDRGIRRARFMTVLAGQNRPAVLLEGGYLSNPDEARLIDKAAHRQKLAEAVARALD